jgi:hypothetical protein
MKIAWENIPQENTQAFFDSMPWRSEALILVHGGFTSFQQHKNSKLTTEFEIEPHSLKKQ